MTKKSVSKVYQNREVAYGRMKLTDFFSSMIHARTGLYVTSKISKMMPLEIYAYGKSSSIFLRLPLVDHINFMQIQWKCWNPNRTTAWPLSCITLHVSIGACVRLLLLWIFFVDYLLDCRHKSTLIAPKHHFVHTYNRTQKQRHIYRFSLLV